MEDFSARKVERSIPVQSRIDLMQLVDMYVFFNDSGYGIRTMSQLVNMIVDLCHDILVVNEKLKYQSESVGEAFEYLESTGLIQRGLRGRTRSKVATALGFENLRVEGEHPRDYAPAKFSQVHNSRRSYSERNRYDPRHLTEKELEEKARQLEDRERRQKAIHEALAKIPSTSDSEGQDGSNEQLKLFDE